MNWKTILFCANTKHKYHIFISTQIFLFLYFCAYRNANPPTEIHPYENFIVMGQFNYVSHNISTWRNKWSEVVNLNKIIIAIPNDTSHPYPTGGRYKYYLADWGFSSPYINLANVIRENENTQGFMMIHDDLILKSSILQKLGGKEWISTNVDLYNFSIYKNSTMESLTNAPKWWKRLPLCLDTFLKMFNDERLGPFKHQSTNQESFITVRRGASDMFYAFLPNSEQRISFLNLLDLFGENNLFLECAIPTAILMMQEKFGVNLYDAPLCTDWKLRERKEDSAEKSKEMVENCAKKEIVKNKVFEAYHPIKIGFNHDWPQLFDYIKNL